MEWANLKCCGDDHDNTSVSGYKTFKIGGVIDVILHLVYIILKVKTHDCDALSPMQLI